MYHNLMLIYYFKIVNIYLCDDRYQLILYLDLVRLSILNKHILIYIWEELSYPMITWGISNMLLVYFYYDYRGQI